MGCEYRRMADAEPAWPRSRSCYRCNDAEEAPSGRPIDGVISISPMSSTVFPL
jgi:hypothetical protein